MLKEAVDAETKILKEAERMNRVTSQMFSRVTGESTAVSSIIVLRFEYNLWCSYEIQ